MSGFRFKPYDLMPYKAALAPQHAVAGALRGRPAIRSATKRDAGWRWTLVGWRKVPRTRLWKVVVERLGRVEEGIFHDGGMLWVNDGVDPAPAWATGGARRNPRGSFRGGGSASRPTSFTSMPTQDFTAAPSSLGPAVSDYPSTQDITASRPGTPVTSMPTQDFTSSPDTPLSSDSVPSDSLDFTSSISSKPGIGPDTLNSIWDAHDVLTSSGKYPGGTLIESLPPGIGKPVYSASGPTGIESGPGIELGPVVEPPDVWDPTTTGPMMSTTKATASGGYLPSPGYIRTSLASQPAPVVPDAKLYRQLIDPQLWRLSDGGDRWAMHELQRRGPGHYLPARPNPLHPSFSEYAQQRERPGRKIGLMARMPRMSRKDLRAMAGAGGSFAQLATYELEYRKWLTKRRHDPRMAANPRARPNPPARGFEFMHADDNEYWAEWAMARQGIPHRGVGYGPGAWPVGARKNPKRGMRPGVAAFFREEGAGPEGAAIRRQAYEAARQAKAEDRRLRERARRRKKGVGTSHMTDAEFKEWVRSLPSLRRKNPRLSALVGGGRGLKVRHIAGSLPSYGSGPAGGYSPSERDALPTSWFLKPETRSWPVADPRHVQIAIQYMTAGRGSPSEYPVLIRRLAKLWPVAAHPALWKIYTRNRAKIARKADKKMPTLAQLRQRR